MNGQKGKNTGITPHIPSETTVPLHGMKPTAEGLSALNGMQVAHQVQGVQGVSSRNEPLKRDDSSKKGVTLVIQAQTLPI